MGALALASAGLFCVVVGLGFLYIAGRSRRGDLPFRGIGINLPSTRASVAAWNAGHLRGAPALGQGGTAAVMFGIGAAIAAPFSARVGTSFLAGAAIGVLLGTLIAIWRATRTG